MTNDSRSEWTYTIVVGLAHIFPCPLPVSICKKHNTKLYVVTREHFSFDLFQAWEVNSLYPVSDKVEQGHILSKPALYLLSSAEYK